MLSRVSKSKEEWNLIIDSVLSRWDTHKEPLSEMQMYLLIEDLYVECLDGRVASEQLRALEHLSSPLRRWVSRREKMRAMQKEAGIKRKKRNWLEKFWTKL